MHREKTAHHLIFCNPRDTIKSFLNCLSLSQISVRSGQQIQQNVSAGNIIKAEAAVMKYALLLFPNGVNKPMGLDIDIGIKNEIFFSL